MLLFITRWLKGLIAGWILGLILFMVKRIVTRAFGNISLDPLDPLDPASRNSAQQRGKPVNDGSVVDTIWAGMTTTQLQQTFGPPSSKNKTGPNSEVWTYTTLGGRTTPTAVTVENGTVKEWENLLL